MKKLMLKVVAAASFLGMLIFSFSGILIFVDGNGSCFPFLSFAGTFLCVIISWLSTEI